MKITRKRLEKAATELQRVMGYEPSITDSLGELSDEQLKTLLVQCIEDILPGDEISSNTEKTLDKLKKETSKNAEPEEKEDPVEDLKSLIVANKKLVDLKNLAAGYEEFSSLNLDSYSGLQGTRQLKADMLGVLKKGKE